MNLQTRVDFLRKQLELELLIHSKNRTHADSCISLIQRALYDLNAGEIISAVTRYQVLQEQTKARNTAELKELKRLNNAADDFLKSVTHEPSNAHERDD